MDRTWKDAARAFFDERATLVGTAPGLADLCFISGRDPRLWMDQALLDDLAQSIVQQAAPGAGGSLLEVGCAAGFIARAVAPRVGKYVGVDMSEAAVKVARRLRLPNAEFRVADGSGLPFPSGTFDAVILYDVYTNFPQFDDGVPIITEMLRVARPGGRVLIGSVPDESVQSGFEARVREVGAELERQHGKAPDPPRRPPRHPLIERLARALRPGDGIAPAIVCYYFRREDFIELGARLGAATEFSDIHARNPYFGFRFNAIYTKAGA